MKIIIILLLTISPLFTQAQFGKSTDTKNIQIGKASSAGTKLATLSYAADGNDTLYNLSYNDMKFQNIEAWKNVYFKGGQKTLDGIFQTLVSALDSAKGTEQTFDLGETKLVVKTAKLLGTKSLSVGFSTNGIVGLSTFTKKTLYTLFGKEIID